MTAITKEGGVKVPVNDVVAGNWNTGIATSGAAGADLVAIGSVGSINRILYFEVNISGLAVGSNLTIRMYRTIGGIERLFYSEIFVVGTDPNGVPVVSEEVISGTILVECNSNAVADDGANIDYEYLLESL